jgi:hypothetical protein
VRALAALVAFVGLTSNVALADPPTDPAAAEGLFEEGRKLLDAGKLAEACPKFEASNRLDPAVGTLLNLGDCNERRGKMASAWSNYRAAESLALTRSDQKRADFARKKADQIQSKLSTLTINVLQPEPGMKVTRDGVEVAEGAWGTAVPVDAGPHVIEARATGKRTNSVKITVPDGAPSSNVVKLDPLVAEASTQPQPDPNPDRPPTKPNEKDTPEVQPSSTNTGRVIGVIGMGAGAVAIGIGAYFAIKAKSTWDDAVTGGHCTTVGLCDDTGFNMNTDARSNGDIATVLITAGIVVAVIGAGAFLFWPKATPPPAAAKPTGFQLHGAGFAF